MISESNVRNEELMILSIRLKLREPTLQTTLRHVFEHEACVLLHEGIVTVSFRFHITKLQWICKSCVHIFLAGKLGSEMIGAVKPPKKRIEDAWGIEWL